MSDPSRRPSDRRTRLAVIGVLGVLVVGGIVALLPRLTTASPPPPPPTPAEVRAQLLELERQMMAEGTYNCCIEPGCEFCPISFGACDCAQRLAQGRPVCGTCQVGIEAGFGSVPGTEDAEPMSGEAAERAYEARRRAYQGD